MWWKKTRAWRWTVLGGFAILLRIILGFFPEFTEAVYSNGLFVLIRWIFDYSINLLPFPSLLLIIAALVFFGIRRRKKRRAGKPPKRNLKQKLGNFGRRLSNTLGALLFFFMFLWGFNYARVSVEEKANLNGDPISIEELMDIAPQVMALTNVPRTQIPNITDSALTADFLPENLELEMRILLEEALTDLGYAPRGSVRCRMVVPNGLIRRIGIQGIYMPFSGEGLVDASLHPTSKPFTIAHEMSHGYGFTDEGTANFLALLACEKSTDPFIRYSGRSALFQYLRHDLREYAPDFYYEFLETMPEGIQNDREAIIENYNNYQSIIPGMAKTVNDIYLKAQGIKEGTKSYDRLVTLGIHWLREKGEF